MRGTAFLIQGVQVLGCSGVTALLPEYLNTGSTEMNPSSDPYYKLRHSTAHLMAQAVGELYPGVKYAIGPPIEDGFYYDLDLPAPIHEEDLERIEQRMRE